MTRKPTYEQLAHRIRTLEKEVLSLKASGAALRRRIQELEKDGGGPNPSHRPLATLPAGKRCAGRVLLMDDDEMIREMTGEKLIRLGYEAALASNGEEAVALFKTAKAAGTPFDVVILDLMVRSGMDGKKAIEQLIEIDPGIKAIVSSGYLNDAVIANFWEYGFKAALAKPYQTSALESLLDSVINEIG